MLLDNWKGMGSSVVPRLRYKNAPSAIVWLCEAFGFEKHFVVVPDADVTQARAQAADAEIVMPVSDQDQGGEASVVLTSKATSGVSEATIRGTRNEKSVLGRMSFRSGYFFSESRNPFYRKPCLF